jgi:hypothetical protein
MSNNKNINKMEKELILEVSEKVEFQVISKKDYVDSYGTGDYTGRNTYVVTRKLMLSDIPSAQGGTKETDTLYSDGVFIKWEKQGLGNFGTFNDQRIAQILCGALNSKEQKELIELIG